MAIPVDARYFFLVALAGFFSLLIAGLIVYYAIKYRRRSPDAVGASIHGGLALELTWTIIPLVITMIIFVWGASVFFAMSRQPDQTLNVYVVTITRIPAGQPARLRPDGHQDQGGIRCRSRFRPSRRWRTASS